VKALLLILVTVSLFVGCATAPRGQPISADEYPGIFELVESGTVEDLRAAVRRGVDINAQDPDGNSVLMDACATQRYDLVPVLLHARVDLDARSRVEGRTALMWAAMYYEVPDRIIELLDAGADAAVRDNSGKSVLDYARENWRFARTEAMRRLEAASR